MSWVLLYFICGFAMLLYGWMTEDWKRHLACEDAMLYLLLVILVLAWPILFYRHIARLLHKTYGWARRKP